MNESAFTDSDIWFRGESFMPDALYDTTLTFIWVGDRHRKTLTWALLTLLHKVVTTSCTIPYL